MSRRGLAVGTVAASIVAACVGNNLSSVEQNNVAIYPVAGVSPIMSYQFGPVSGSATAHFTINPAASTDDDNVNSIAFTSMSACIDFTRSLDGGQLPAEVCNGTTSGLTPTQMALCPPYPFAVTFTPQSVGVQNCILRISSTQVTGGAPNPDVDLTLSGSGMGTQYDFSVGPGSLDFASVPIGTQSSSRTITITNKGESMISIHVAEPASVYGFTPSGSDFSLAANAGSASIQPITVTCTPNLGSNDAIVTVSSSMTPLIRSVMLTCIGVNTSLAITPNPIDFGTVVIPTPTEPNPIPVKVTNSPTGGTVTITSISLMGADPDVTLEPPAPANLTIPQNTSQTPVTVHYAASHEQPPGSLGTLVMQTNTGTLTYPITGGARTGSIGTNPASVDFGVVCTGRTATQDVGVYANGTADVDVHLDGPPAAPFMAMMASGIVHGSHNGESTLAVSVAPAATDLGELKGQVQLDTDIPTLATYMLDVTAFGVPDAKMAATPESVDFGQVTKDTTSSGKRIEFSNCAGAGTSANVTDAQITGPDASTFRMVSPSMESIPQQLGDGKSETFLIAMSPRTVGKLHAQLDITYSGGSVPTVSVPLAGEGVLPPTDRKTYYACSVGTGAEAWPIGLALLALRRRRRGRALS